MNKLFLSLFFSLGMTACTLGVAVRDEPLLDRYWRALEIDGQAVVVTNNRAEPHLVLASEKIARMVRMAAIAFMAVMTWLQVSISADWHRP